MSTRTKIERAILVASLIAAIAGAPMAALAASLDTAEGRTRYTPGERITVIFDGAVTSPMDHLLLERADGTKIESYPLGIRPPRARGAWQFVAKPGQYVVRWIAADGPSRAWALEQRAELALVVGPPARPVERWQVNPSEEAEPEIVMPDEPSDLAPEGTEETVLAPPDDGELVTVVEPEPVALRPPRSRDWRPLVNEEYGTTIAYPANIFEPVGSEDSEGQEFVARDGGARFGIYAGEQSETLKDMRKRFLSDPEYGRVSYKPMGKSWFVLSGYRDGGKVFYEKYVLRADGVLHAFAMEFPEDQRALYAPIVERMEDSFRAG